MASVSSAAASSTAASASTGGSQFFAYGQVPISNAREFHNANQNPNVRNPVTLNSNPYAAPRIPFPATTNPGAPNIIPYGQFSVPAGGSNTGSQYGARPNPPVAA